MKQFGLMKKGVRRRRLRSAAAHPRLIHEGHLDFTIDQQPYLQGFYTAMEMFTFKLSGGLTGPAEINTGLKFVTKGNVAPYLKDQDPV